MSTPNVLTQSATTRMNLTVSERFMLSILLPQKGSRRTVATAATVEQIIGFDEGEALAFGIRYTDDGAMLYDKEGETSFDFTTEQCELMRHAVQLADDDGRITRDMLSLLDKIDVL